MTQRFGCILLSCGMALCLLMGVSSAADHKGRTVSGDLVGAWQLVSIQLTGPKGPMNDPFYNADPTGVLIYDASGWMSVQIASQPRPSMSAAASRSGGPYSPATAELAAKVLDTYYAYTGTWEFDAVSSIVTHHIKTSLIPGENGVSYSQAVTLDGGKLTFTVRREAPGGSTVQQKIWRKIDIRAP
jgi:Lipocalin-like domain